MAFENNDLKRILILVLFAIPMIASRNIDCSGRAFHCVNSTHFMICVDLGGGLSTTIDDFVIPCPATTVCHINNIFECDFPEVEVTTPPLQVIDIFKQSDTSETSLVTTSATTPTPTSEILSVFKENITATTLPTPEDVTPVFKLEVLEDIKNPITGNSDNTTEPNNQVNPSFIYTTNETVNDKQTSNNTITTSATDNNKNVESAVEPSIHKAVNTSLTDKTKSIDTVTSVIGIINLISSDHPTLVSTKSSSDVLTSLDTFYDNIATTTEQYSTKQVIIQRDKAENVTETIHNETIPTEIIFDEKSVITDEVSSTPVINKFTDKDINNSIKNINTTDSDNQTLVKRDSLDKSNRTNELVSESTTEYFITVKIDNNSDPVTEAANPLTTTDKTTVPLKLDDLIPVDSSIEMVPSTKSSSDNLNTLNDKTKTTINQNNTNQKTILSDIPVTTEIISTNSIFNTNTQNINKSDTDNDFFTQLNSTVKITTTEKVPEINTNISIPEPGTVANLQTTTEKTFVPLTKETTIIYPTSITPTSGDLIENYSLVEKHTTGTQPLEKITTTDSSIKITDDLYQLNQTLESTKNNTANTLNTTETFNTVYNASTKDTINDESTDPTISLTTNVAKQNEFIAHATEIINVLPEMKGASVNEPYVTNVKNDTLLNHTHNLTENTTENVKTVFNASSTDIINNKGTEHTTPTTIKYKAIEILPTETRQNEFTVRPVETISELPATNIDNVETNTLLRVQTTPTPSNVTSDAVANTTVKDLTSQSDFITNAQTDFTPDIIEVKTTDGYTSIDQPTTQKVTIYPETKIPGSLNQQDYSGSALLQVNLNADQWTTTVADKDLVNMSTTDLNNVESSVTTPFPDDVTKNNGNADIIAAINKVNSQNVLPKTNDYVSESTSTTPNTFQSKSISLDTKTTQEVSTNVPEYVHIYSASTTDDKAETSTTLSVDLEDTTNIENVRDFPTTILPTQELAIQKNVTVNQLNTRSTTTEVISDFPPSTITTTGYPVPNTHDIDLNTELLRDLVSTEPIIYEVDTNVDLNKTITVNQINGKYTDTSHSTADHIIKDENFTIVPIVDIIHSSVNAMPTGAMQISSSYVSLTNDNVKTTQSQDSSVYVPVTDNIPDYNLVQVAESVTQKTQTQTIVSSAETKLMSSVLATPSTHTLPRIEIVTENDKYVNTEPTLSSRTVPKQVNPVKTYYVGEKTNDHILSTEAILTQINKVHKVDSDSFSSSVSSFTPDTAAPPKGGAVPLNNKITTVIDSAFTMDPIQMSPKVAVDEDNIEITTEYPLSTSKVVETVSTKHNTEPLLTISKVSVERIGMTTEPTSTTNTFSQTMPSLSTTGEANQDVISGIKTTDLPQNVLSTVKNNIPQLIQALHTAEVTFAKITSEPSSRNKIFSQTTPSLATTGKSNSDVPPEIKTTDLPQNIISKVTSKVPQSTPALHKAEVTDAQVTSEPISTTNTFAQSMPSFATTGKPNSDVPPEFKTTNLPQNIISKVNSNVPQSTPALQTAGVTDAQFTSEPIPITNTVPQTTPSLATIGETNQAVQPGIRTTDLPQNIISKVNSNVLQSTSALQTAGVTDAQVTSEPISKTNTVTQTTPSLTTIGKKDQDEPGVKTIYLPQNVLSALNNNIPQSTPAPDVAGATAAKNTAEPAPKTYTAALTMPSLATTQNALSKVNNYIPQPTPALHTAEVTDSQVTSEPIPITNLVTQTSPSLATIGETTQDVQPGMKITDLPQKAGVNKNVSQLTATLHIAGVTAGQDTVAPTLTANTFAQPMPSLVTIGKKNQGVMPDIKNTYLPQNVLSVVNINVAQSTPAPNTAEVTDAQNTAEPTLTTFAQTTSSLGVMPEIKTTNLPQYGMPTVNNYNPVVTDITTKTIIDSLSVPDFIAETITVDGDKVSGTSVGDTISSGVTSSNPTVPSKYGVKAVKNIIDHESIVIGNTSKDNSQNTTTMKSVDINKVEIVNNTESDWIRPDVNIDGIQIKESETEEAETSKFSVTRSAQNPQTKTLHTDSTKIAHINPMDVKTLDIIDSKITKVTPNPYMTETESIAPKNYAQSKRVIIKDSSVNKNIETPDAKKYKVQVDSKHFTDSYNVSNTKPNITTSYNNVSQQNSTINDELEQHLLSGNHTITAEIQSHLNESGKQSNKTSNELSFNVTSTNNSNPATLKLNAASKNKSAIAVPASVFNCSNRTRGKYADNKDCRKFYTCIGNLQPMLGTCPNNTVFSEINKQCTKNLSHCVRNNQFHCLFEGRFSDFFKDNIYYICVKNRIHGFIRYKLQCQNDYHLNKASVKCEKNEELSSTQSVSSVSETNTDESKPKPKSEKIISTDNFECKKEGNFPYVKDCSKYYACTKIKNVYRRKIKKCASDEVFDKEEKKCVESDSGEC